MATHFNILAWRISKDRGAWQATVHGVTKKLDVTERLILSQFSDVLSVFSCSIA